MQTMLRMIGMGDNIGSGFPTMLDACKKENWRKPMLNERPDLRLVQLTISMVSLISPETDRSLLEIYGKAYQKISKEEQYVLATALTEGSVANYTIQLQLNKNPLEAGKLLYAMVAQNLLISTNKGRWTTYSINYDFAPNAEKARDKRQGVNKKSRSKSQGVSEKSRSKSQGVEETIWSKWHGADGVALDIRSWSTHKIAIVEKVLLLCQSPRTLAEIAKALGYSDRYRMKKHYIDSLLGVALAMSAAEKNSPTQKYITIATKEEIRR